MHQPVPDFASAAVRHLRDAEHLLDNPLHSCRDQAWHLAGFAHECARKACIAAGWVPKLLGHDFGDSSEEVVAIAIALDPRSGRFPVREWATRYPAVQAWRAEHRYERTGTADGVGRPIEDLVAQGRKAVEGCLVALFLDGSLDMKSMESMR
jgi:hypothetical protein